MSEPAQRPRRACAELGEAELALVDVDGEHVEMVHLTARAPAADDSNQMPNACGRVTRGAQELLEAFCAPAITHRTAEAVGIAELAALDGGAEEPPMEGGVVRHTPRSPVKRDEGRAEQRCRELTPE
jgi:hypothetical protein